MSCFETSGCLEEVIKIIEDKLDNTQQQKLLRKLKINSGKKNLVFSEKLEDIPWNKIEYHLELLGRKDVVDLIKKNTLITEGIK